ncbi:MAG: LacI family DNA-binding transcriptional regulator [bacterium]|nr:LacI family DNA-binding transcriptional regulator [bacterium]
MPTIKDVAKEAGVSIATVSYVLNNKDTSISEDTRRLVLAAIERIGYTPNATARNLKSNQTKLIGYAWHRLPPDQVNSVLDHFTYYLAQAAEAAGYHILTFTHTSDNWMDVYDELIRARRVDGFVLAGTEMNDRRIAFLMEKEFPFVSFGRSTPEWDFPWVDTDGQQGMMEAVSYLIECGHRQIGMVAWPTDSIAGNFRMNGYREALRCAGIPFRQNYIWRGPHSVQTGRDALAHYLALPEDERPTAIVAVSDLVAIGVLNEAEHRRVPVGKRREAGELAVVGFDDVPLSEFLRPALTTLRQPIPEIAHALIHMLHTLLLDGIIEQREVLFAPRLMVRGSA